VKICWDNLNKLYFDMYNNFWLNKYNVKYVYKENCKTCGEPYLMRVSTPTKFCCGSCSKKGKNHPLYGKKLSENHRYRIGNSLKGHKISNKTKKKISLAHKGKGYNKSGTASRNYKGGVTKLNLPLYDTYYKRLEQFEDVRRNPNNIDLLQVKCTNNSCKEWFTPKRTSVCDRINSIKFNYVYGESRFYCCDECKNSCSIYGQILYPKSSNMVVKEYTSYELHVWSSEVLKRANYVCEYCNKSAKYAHHIRPKKLEPFFALDPDYGISCCKECHYKYGHKEECSTGNLAREVCI